MLKTFQLIFILLMAASLSGFAQDAQDVAPPSTGPAIIAGNGGPIASAPGAVLFDQGQLVNDPGGGSGGADRSFIESALGHTLYGWGHQVLNNNSMADDFTVPAGETWTIDELITFAYQTNATTTSTITEVRAQIWDGDPSAGGTIIWGDLTTNIMTSTIWSNIYRTNETTPSSTARAIMKQTSTIGTTLTEGTYWLQWMTNGTLSSGPWCPPVTILGVANTGNALQSLAGVWGPALNGTEPNGAPFILMGSVGGGGNTFTDNFDSYTAGVQLTTQTTEWTTWSGTPGTGEDPFVSNTYSYSSPNSVVIVQNNDLVRMHGPQTTGLWYMSFLFYIPATHSGYFNTMNAFSPDPFTWGMDCYFDVGGGGRVDTTGGGGGGANDVPFTYAVDQWNQAMVVVDLDATPPTAELWIGQSAPLTMVATWDWTQGGTKPAALAVNDFFGAAATDEMYMDNYYFGDTPPAIIPVELTSFAANVNGTDVTLNWSTATETNNQGFEVQRSLNGSEFVKVGYIAGHGTVTETMNYSFIDRALEVGSYSYRLKQLDFDGSFEYSNIIEVEVGAPALFSLAQNYPNPFNPSTIIEFNLASDSKVTLKVFDALGQEVATLINGNLAAGSREISFDASALNSGVYFYRIDATGVDGTNFSSVKKMILTK